MAGSARITGMLPAESREAGIEIPVTAVFSRGTGGESLVWIIDPASNTLQSREVVTGRLTAKGVLVREGLAPGDWVVVKGVNSVTEGETVRIMDLSGEGPAS